MIIIKSPSIFFNGLFKLLEKNPKFTSAIPYFRLFRVKPVLADPAETDQTPVVTRLRTRDGGSWGIPRARKIDN